MWVYNAFTAPYQSISNVPFAAFSEIWPFFSLNRGMIRNVIIPKQYYAMGHNKHESWKLPVMQNANFDPTILRIHYETQLSNSNAAKLGQKWMICPGAAAFQSLDTASSPITDGKLQHRAFFNLPVKITSPSEIQSHGQGQTSFSMALQQNLGQQQQILHETAVATMKKRLLPQDAAMNVAAKRARQAYLRGSTDPKSVSYAERLMSGLIPSAQAASASMHAYRPISLPSQPRSPSETLASFPSNFLGKIRGTGSVSGAGTAAPIAAAATVPEGARLCSGPSESSMSVARLIN